MEWKIVGAGSRIWSCWRLSQPEKKLQDGCHVLFKGKRHFYRYVLNCQCRPIYDELYLITTLVCWQEILQLGCSIYISSGRLIVTFFLHRVSSIYPNTALSFTMEYMPPTFRVHKRLGLAQTLMLQQYTPRGRRHCSVWVNTRYNRSIVSYSISVDWVLACRAGNLPLLPK